MSINTTHLQQCIDTLEAAYKGLQQVNAEDVLYNVYRAACVKEFELVLEQGGRLLKRRLRPWFASNSQADRISFRDTFRYANKFGVISIDACERWLEYRDKHNSTAHDYGENFAEGTLRLLPTFIADAKDLLDALKEPDDD